MKRAIWTTLLAIVAFAVILIARLPARWLSGFTPEGVSCAELAGTVWNGACGGLLVQNVQVGNITWHLHPARLFSGKLAAAVDLRRGTHFARGDVEAGSGGTITARNVRAELPLDPALLPQLPRNVSGTVNANLTFLRVENGVISAVQGLLEAHDLVQGAGANRLELGDYSLTFPAADPRNEPVGTLKSLSGPLNVTGTLRLTREPGFVLEGLVSAAPGAPASLVQELRYLGAPDAQGRRPFSVAATF